MFGLWYWTIPLFAGTVWLGTLAGMLGQWLHAGSPHYPWMAPEQRIAYISDIGAGFLKPLFMAGSITMAVVFDFAFISERWLRHRNRLVPNYSRREAFLSVCSIFFAIVGAVALILLTIFDIKQYHWTHYSLLMVFVIAYIISAIFVDAEYQRLGSHFRQYRVLRISFWIKLVFIFVELGLAIGFGICTYHHKDVAAVIEWTLSFLFIFYVWSFVLDFLPARHTKPADQRFPPLRKRDHPELDQMR